MLKTTPDRLRNRRRSIEHLFGNLQWGGIVLVICILTFLDLFINSLLAFVNNLSFEGINLTLVENPIAYVVISLLLLWGALAIAKGKTKAYLGAVLQVKEMPQDFQTDTVVMFLSALNNENYADLETYFQKTSDTETQPEDLKTWLLDKTRHLSWAMNFYGVKHHIKSRRNPLRVILVASNESRRQVTLFRKLFQAIFGETVNILEPSDINKELENEVNFHSIEDIHTLLLNLLRLEIKANHSVVFDVTSGTKPVSIAGSIVATGEDGSCTQYVQNGVAKITLTHYEKELHT